MKPAAILQAIRDLRILVVGDLILDHYLSGDVQRISPEAPVPVVNAVRESHVAGGAANVAHNLAALGVATHIAGSIGDDENGRRLVDLLENAGIDTRLCHAEASRPTIVKTRVIARNQQLCRIDREAPRAQYAIGSPDEIEAALADIDAVIFSDYAKGAITQGLLDALLPAATACGVWVSIDPKPSRKLAFRDAGLITPNRHEALELAGLPEPEPGGAYPLEEAARRIHEAHAPRWLVITLGADGMAICRDGCVERVLPTRAREVFDVSGAGDTVIATLTAALAAGADAESAAHFANLAAGDVVSKMGTAVPSLDAWDE